MSVQWKELRRGVWLVDSHSQYCVVVRKQKGVLLTRRFDSEGYWDCVARWIPESFAQCLWFKTKARTRRKQPRLKSKEIRHW